MSLNTFRKNALFAIATLLLFASGCSNIEPKFGTRVVIEIKTNAAISRETIAASCKFLLRRARACLNSQKPRIQSARGNRIVLLLPGEGVFKQKLETLIHPRIVEFRHLDMIKTKNNPSAKYKIIFPNHEKHVYSFVSADGTVFTNLDRGKIKSEIWSKAKTIVVPDSEIDSAIANDKRGLNGYSVTIKFTENGARRLRNFSSARKGEYVGFFCDGVLLSIAAVNKVIQGDSAELDGFLSPPDAYAVAISINERAVPAPMEIISVDYY